VSRLQIVHRASAVVVALVVPAVLYLVNGEAEPWAFALGALIGFSYWYFFPFPLP
jgi:hypothetical protein